ncbi:hypothetical protein HanXRQr2_Chr16g0730441 [Helianthus annuus]|uniref:Uncharacterized protein n=1 Tax=Helianthus annuus TaxID=4232 RepID=A0A9K3DQR3_HELAN|nr:hypothetical protein HanXRQr2_Chr16g0730441 [Helianthus annuus]
MSLSGEHGEQLVSTFIGSEYLHPRYESIGFWIHPSIDHMHQSIYQG